MNLNEKLIKASKEGLFKELRVLIKSGADVNTPDDYGNTSLDYLFRYKNTLKFFEEINKIINLEYKYGLVTFCCKLCNDTLSKDIKRDNFVLSMDYKSVENILFRLSPKILNNYRWANKSYCCGPIYRENNLLCFNNHIVGSIQSECYVDEKPFCVLNPFMINIKVNDKNILENFLNDYRKLLAFLIKSGADFNTTNREDVLVWCLINGEIELAKLLIKHGADVNAKVKYGHYTEYKAVMLTIFNWNQELAKLLIKHGADVNPRFIDEETALMETSYYGNQELAKLLIKHGADVNAKDRYGKTALMYASSRGNKEMVELLIKHGADVNAKDRYEETALIHESEKKGDHLAELLIKHGADVNAKDRYGKTALMYASSRGNKEIVELLINYGADVNYKTNSGWNALISALDNEEKEVYELLINNGAINDLFTLSIIGDLKKAKELIDKGVDLNAVVTNISYRGFTALMLASKKGNKEMVELLINHGADVNYKTGFYKDYMDPPSELYKQIDELLNYNKVNVNDEIEGETALMLASEFGHKEVAELLIKSGAKN